MSISEEEKNYDLKGSTALIGQLYPVLKSKDGDLLDGFHRVHADSSWKVEVLDTIDSEEKKLAARLIANIHRRTVSKEEKESWINDLAELYLKQGLKVQRRVKGKQGQGANEIKDRIVMVTGLSKRVVSGYLKDCYKQMNFSRGVEQRKISTSAAEVIVNILNGRSGANNGYGERLMERFKEEYTAELLTSPAFRFQVMNSMPKGKGFKRVIGNVEVLGYSGDENGDPVGIIKRKLPKGEGMPKKETSFTPVDVSYFDTFMEECPNCLCATCPHAEECKERVRADEPITITVYTRRVNHSKS